MISSVVMRDHPRVCGEKLAQPRHTPPGRGSPPRVRGEVDGRELFQIAQGITPACAGRSRRLESWIYHRKDHPRVCGEKWIFPENPVENSGSPPRVRGED